MTGFKRMRLKIAWGIMPEIEKRKYVWGQMRKGGNFRDRPKPEKRVIILESD